MGFVLILVLVEDGLRDTHEFAGYNTQITCLNPCSCGGWSQSVAKDITK